MVAPMATWRIGCSAAVIDSKLYVAGGKKKLVDIDRSHKVLSTVERYDPSADSWEVVPEMTMGLEGLELCS